MHSLIIIQFPCFTLKIGAVSKRTPPHHNDERGVLSNYANLVFGIKEHLKALADVGSVFLKRLYSDIHSLSTKTQNKGYGKHL